MVVVVVVVLVVVVMMLLVVGDDAIGSDVGGDNDGGLGVFNSDTSKCLVVWVHAPLFLSNYF